MRKDRHLAATYALCGDAASVTPIVKWPEFFRASRRFNRAPQPEHADVLFPVFDPASFQLDELPGWAPDGSLLAARAQVEACILDGSACPACTQWCEVHPRQIYVQPACWLKQVVQLQGATKHGWVDIKLTDVRGGDYAKLVYWHLVEQHFDREGWWRATSFGVKFVRNEVSVTLRQSSVLSFPRANSSSRSR